MSSDAVELWLKAGSDGSRLGGDPICHQIFMTLIEKSIYPESGLKFNARTVNESKPTEEFRKAGLRHTPALQYGPNITFSHPDEIVEYIDINYPIPTLKNDDAVLSNVASNLFRAFAFFMRQIDNDFTALENELKLLNNRLASCKTKFLTSDRLTHIDIYILTKLHTIRISCQALKNYQVPPSLENIWSYLKHVYETESFRKSCPCDQEIILYWSDRSDTPNLSLRERSRLCQQAPTYTFDIPAKSDKRTIEDFDELHKLNSMSESNKPTTDFK